MRGTYRVRRVTWSATMKNDYPYDGSNPGARAKSTNDERPLEHLS